MYVSCVKKKCTGVLRNEQQEKKGLKLISVLCSFRCFYGSDVISRTAPSIQSGLSVTTLLWFKCPIWIFCLDSSCWFFAKCSRVHRTPLHVGGSRWRDARFTILKRRIFIFPGQPLGKKKIPQIKDILNVYKIKCIYKKMYETSAGQILLHFCPQFTVY